MYYQTSMLQHSGLSRVFWCLCAPGECESNILSTCSSVLVSTNPPKTNLCHLISIQAN